MKHVIASAAAAMATAAGLALAGVPAAAPAGAATTAASAVSSTAARATGPAAVRPLVRTNVTVPSTHLPHLTPGETASSGNWSGYGDVANKGVSLRYVQADWNVPSISCARSALGSQGAAITSNWVGLDGLNSKTVEQTGTTAECAKGSSTPTYFAWYELYPNAPVEFSGVAAGDAVNASVYFNGTKYEITLTDLTTNSSIPATTRACPTAGACKNSSAEVIVEDPGNSAPDLGLADFGQANFTNAQVTSRNGTKGTLASSSLWKSTQINMVDTTNGHELAKAGPLEGGAAFADTWIQSL